MKYSLPILLLAIGLLAFILIKVNRETYCIDISGGFGSSCSGCPGLPKDSQKCSGGTIIPKYQEDVAFRLV